MNKKRIKTSEPKLLLLWLFYQRLLIRADKTLLPGQIFLPDPENLLSLSELTIFRI